MNDDRNRSRDTRRRLAVADFKRCPLCGALNADTNLDCFVCSWHGSFDRDHERVSAALEYLVERCPQIASDLEPPQSDSPFFRAKRWLVKRVARWIAP
ncbi:MAG TPA: hypothetical protein VGE01_02640 [Fimbriimonas sp.]